MVGGRGADEGEGSAVEDGGIDVALGRERPDTSGGEGGATLGEAAPLRVGLWRLFHHDGMTDACSSNC